MWGARAYAGCMVLTQAEQSLLKDDLDSNVLHLKLTSTTRLKSTGSNPEEACIGGLVTAAPITSLAGRGLFKSVSNTIL